MWRDETLYKISFLDQDQKIKEILDKYDTMLVFAEDATSIDDMTNKISSLFSDDVGGIVCSSAHRSKGLEAKRVALIRPDLMPHPAAKSQESKKQEINSAYVASTRSLGDFIILDSNG